MKHVISATLALMMSANGALALSCMRPDALSSYKAAAEASEPYVVVSGVLAHQMPPSEQAQTGEPKVVSFTAQLVGRYLRDDGFTGNFSAPVDVTLNCVSEWCATLPPQRASVLAFLQIKDDAYVLDVQPCQQWLFQDPEPEQMVALFACHTEGDCTPG
ncbi:hypothetical protein [Pseudooceanicola sp. MF1-13]|uniref:hypothetical protein n=1 Tax=Pseudooceanicola sp. MF1-13 TaxID=3379095 RepID=UPI0038925391